MSALSKLSMKQRVFLGLGLYVLLIVGFAVGFGWSRDDNDHFKPEEEFKLDTWFEVGPIAFNKGVMYVIIAGIITVWTMVYVAKRMQMRPNRVQTAVEFLFTMMRDTIVRDNMDRKTAAKWFPFIATIFLFIWFSNLIGYIPLPTNSGHKFDLFGAKIPSFALFAATANLSIPLVLAFIVWIGFNVEGVRNHGFIGYLKGLIPEGVPGPMRPFIFVLELVSNFMRLISLSVRLFANILAGHLIILFMGGALVVLLGIEALGIVSLPLAIALFMFEVGLVATLQAFIFGTLAAIYLGEATAGHH